MTTTDVDLLSLGAGTRLHFLPDDGKDVWEQDHAIVVVQGLRNPCPQIDKFRKGLKENFIIRDSERNIIARTAGVMGTVEVGGRISTGMRILVEPAAECMCRLTVFERLWGEIDDRKLPQRQHCIFSSRSS